MITKAKWLMIIKKISLIILNNKPTDKISNQGQTHMNIHPENSNNTSKDLHFIPRIIHYLTMDYFPKIRHTITT